MFRKSPSRKEKEKEKNTISAVWPEYEQLLKSSFANKTKKISLEQLNVDEACQSNTVGPLKLNLSDKIWDLLRMDISFEWK